MCNMKRSFTEITWTVAHGWGSRWSDEDTQESRNGASPLPRKIISTVHPTARKARSTVPPHMLYSGRFPTKFRGLTSSLPTALPLYPWAVLIDTAVQ